MIAKPSRAALAMSVQNGIVSQAEFDATFGAEDYHASVGRHLPEDKGPNVVCPYCGTSTFLSLRYCGAGESMRGCGAELVYPAASAADPSPRPEARPPELTYFTDGMRANMIFVLRDRFGESHVEIPLRVFMQQTALAPRYLAHAVAYEFHVSDEVVEALLNNAKRIFRSDFE